MPERNARRREVDLDCHRIAEPNAFLCQSSNLN
jgi:hypothetical protein